MIHVYGLEGPLVERRERLGNVLHECLVEVLGMPPGKRAQRFFPMARENFYYPEGRSDSYTFITILMMSGRTKETRKRLVRRLFERVEQDVGIAPNDLEICIQESAPENWGFRGQHGDEIQLTYKVNV